MWSLGLDLHYRLASPQCQGFRGQPIPNGSCCNPAIVSPPVVSLQLQLEVAVRVVFGLFVIAPFR